MVMRTKPKRPPPSQDEVVIRVRGVVNVLGGNLVHDHLDLDVKRGEVLGVVGGSGSGKSVLLRTIVGLQRPAEGEINVLGEHIGALRGRSLRALQMRWGVLFQDGALFSSQTVAQNIQVPLREYLHLPHDLMNEVAAVKLALVGLPADAGLKYPSELSGGMKKRAGLARALALDPSLPQGQTFAGYSIAKIIGSGAALALVAISGLYLIVFFTEHAILVWEWIARKIASVLRFGRSSMA